MSKAAELTVIKNFLEQALNKMDGNIPHVDVAISAVMEAIDHLEYAIEELEK